MKTHLAKLLALLALLATLAPAALGAPGDLDTVFNPNANGNIYGVTVQPDGKVVLGGYFTTVGGQTRNRVARLNADGTLDTAFNPNANGGVNGVAVQADGKILFGGQFSTVGGQTRNNLARIDANGALDTSFNPNPDNALHCLALQADGKILIGGQFTTVGGVGRNRIARLNPDGTLDTLFDAGKTGPLNVDSIAVQADGKIVIGGSFTLTGGVTRNRIARLNADGTLDTGFDPNADAAVPCVAVQADGKILLGGTFAFVGGIARNRIARLNADGTLDTSFNPNANGNIDSIAIQTDGKIVIGGSFTTVGGAARSRIARLNPNGTLDTAFNPSAGDFANCLALQADGKVFVGGAFTAMSGTTRNHAARVENDPATQSLTVPNSGSVQWLRGGSSPEILQVTFELSVNNGATWTLLGSGGRIPGGWGLTGLSLPAGGQVRARARTASGNFNGSSGLIETAAVVDTTANACATKSVILNTGYNHAAGALYSIGAAESFWTVVSDPDTGTSEPRPATVIQRNSAWAQPLADSQWISSYASAANERNGTYDFQTRFCLAEGWTNALLQLSLRADDRATVYLNNSTIPIGATASSGSFNSAQPTTIQVNDQSKFQTGVNTLVVRVENTQAVAMGLNLTGSVSGSGLLVNKPECCQPNASITGRKFDDQNGDGAPDGGEPWLAGWTMILSSGTNTWTTLTDSNGYYYFLNLLPGPYTVAEQQVSGWVQTAPAGGSHAVTLAQAQAVNGLNFGNRKNDCAIKNVILNTGYNHAAGTLYSIGAAESFWTVVADPDNGTTEPRPATVIQRNSAWAQPMTDSQWISSYASAANERNGTYDFQTRFCLAEGWTNALLQLSLRADDRATVYLNNSTIPIGATASIGSFNSAQPTTIQVTTQSMFVTGVNTLLVRVENTQAVAMGLNLTGSVSATGLSVDKPECCQPGASLSGQKFNDRNGNGVKDAGEPGLPGWTIQLSPGDLSTVTDSHGNYYFHDLKPGAYTVSEKPQPCWIQTAPTNRLHTITLGLAQTINNLDFGNQLCESSPVIQCPSNIVVRSCTNVVVNYTVTATNACCGEMSVVLTPPSGSTFAPGTTNTVRAATTDCCGKTATCSFTVIVECVTDTCLTLVCPTNKTVACGADWKFDLPAATSCCGTNITIRSTGIVTNGVSCPQVFTQTWLATDACGNTKTCTQTVTVVDATPSEACGLTGLISADGTTITYQFTGALADPFGSLAAGTPFTGSFSYSVPQADLSPNQTPNRGDYHYTSISLTIGNQTVTDSGTGVINIYDQQTTPYPTDLFVLYTFNLNGSLGGLTLAPGAGIVLNLQDLAGTAWPNTALPDPGLTMANLTVGPATFLQLQSASTGVPGATIIARGPLGCATTPPLPPTVNYAGRDHRSLGNATLNVVSNRLIVGEIRTNALSGVSIDARNAGGINLHWLPPNLVSDGNSLSVTALGVVGGVPGKTLVDARATKVGDAIQLSALFPAIPSSEQTVELLLEGNLVARYSSLGSDLVVRSLPIQNGGNPPRVPCDYHTFIHWNGNLSWVETIWTYQDISLLGTGGPCDPGPLVVGNSSPVLADAVRFISPTVANSMESLGEVQVTGAGIRELIVDAVALQAFDFPNAAVGNARLEAQGNGGRLLVSNLGSGGMDGVKVSLNGAAGLRAGIDLTPLWGHAGAQLLSASRGRAGAGAEKSLGMATLTGTSTGLALNVDFAALGADKLRVRFYDATNNLIRAQDVVNKDTLLIGGSQRVELYNCPPGTVPVGSGSWIETGHCCPTEIWRFDWNGDCSPINVWGDSFEAIPVHSFTVEPLDNFSDIVTLSSVSLTARNLSRFTVVSEKNAADGGEASASMERDGDGFLLNYGGGTLARANAITGPWTEEGKVGPIKVQLTSASQFFLLLAKPWMPSPYNPVWGVSTAGKIHRVNPVTGAADAGKQMVHSGGLTIPVPTGIAKVPNPAFPDRFTVCSREGPQWCALQSSGTMFWFTSAGGQAVRLGFLPGRLIKDIEYNPADGVLYGFEVDYSGNYLGFVKIPFLGSACYPGNSGAAPSVTIIAGPSQLNAVGVGPYSVAFDYSGQCHVVSAKDHYRATVLLPAFTLVQGTRIQGMTSTMNDPQEVAACISMRTLIIATLDEIVTIDPPNPPATTYEYSFYHGTSTSGGFLGAWSKKSNNCLLDYTSKPQIFSLLKP